MANCDSCGAEDTEVFPVRRMYLTTGDDGQPGEDQVLVEVEQWCFPCLTHYPHQPVE